LTALSVKECWILHKCWAAGGEIATRRLRRGTFHFNREILNSLRELQSLGLIQWRRKQDLVRWPSAVRLSQAGTDFVYRSIAATSSPGKPNQGG